jgi:hypothetical protein
LDLADVLEHVISQVVTDRIVVPHRRAAPGLVEPNVLGE